MIKALESSLFGFSCPGGVSRWLGKSSDEMVFSTKHGPDTAWQGPTLAFS